MPIERASDNPFPSILMVEGDPEALATDAAAGQRRLAVGTDHLLYLVDDAGVKTAVGSAGVADILDIPTAETDDTLVLAPDGAGGVEFRAETGGAPTLASAKYKRTSGDYTTSSNTFVDVDATNLALTITTGARRVLVVLTASGYHTNTNDYIGLDVDLDGTRMIGGNFGLFIHAVVGSEPTNCSFSIVSDVLTAASHTFKLQYRRSSAGSTVLYGTGNAQLVFSVVELL